MDQLHDPLQTHSEGCCWWLTSNTQHAELIPAWQLASPPHLFTSDPVLYPQVTNYCFMCHKTWSHELLVSRICECCSVFLKHVCSLRCWALTVSCRALQALKNPESYLSSSCVFLQRLKVTLISPVHFFTLLFEDWSFKKRGHYVSNDVFCYFLTFWRIYTFMMPSRS